MPLENMIARVKAATLNQFGDELKCYVPLQGKIFNGDITFDLVDRVKEFIVNQDQSAVLLLGQSGGGKSLFCQQLVSELWQQFDVKSPRIPLWINLPSIENPSQNLIWKHLQMIGVGEEDRHLLLNNCSLFVILDGADEIICEQNLFDTNNFAKSNIKILTTLRREALKPNYQMYFKPSSSTLSEYEILPFNKEQRSLYLKQFLKHHESLWDEEKFTQQIEEIVDLEELISNPYHFYLTLSTLPSIVAKYATQDNKLKRIKLTRNDLYREFVQQRFIRQEEKLRVAKNKQVLELLTKKREQFDKPSLTLIDLFQEYCHKLAQAMFEHNVNKISYRPISSADLNIQEPQPEVGSSHSGAINREKKKLQDPNSWMDEFFDDKQSPELELIRSGCPLKQIGPGEWIFFHKSLLEYFMADQLFNGAILDVQILTGQNLNASNLQREPAVMQFLVDRVKTDVNFKQTLFDIIELSKSESSVWKAAANAITILNYAGVCLSGMDFRRVRIGGFDEVEQKGWGADLSHCHLHGSDFSEADLRNVKLIKTNLDYVKFRDACVSGINFGERPYWFKRFGALSTDWRWLVVKQNRQFLFEVWDSFDVYEIKSRKLIANLDPRYRSQMLINPNNKQLVVYGWDTTNKYSFIWLFSLETKAKTIIKHRQNIRTVCFNPNGNTLAINYDDNIVFIRTSDGECISEWRDAGKNFQLLYSPDGTKLVALNDYWVRMSEVATGKPIFHFLNLSRYRSMIFNPDNSQLAFLSSKDHTLHLNNAINGLLDFSLPKNLGINEYIYSPDGAYIAIRCFNESVQIWSSKNRTIINSWSVDVEKKPEHIRHQEIPSLAYHPDGRSLAISVATNVQIWDTFTKTKTKILPSMQGFISYLRYHPESLELLIASRDEIRFWDSSYWLENINTYQKYDNGNFTTRDHNLAIDFELNNRAYNKDFSLAVAWSRRSRRLEIWSLTTKKLVAKKWDIELNEPDTIERAPSIVFNYTNEQVAFLPTWGMSINNPGNKRLRVVSSEILIWNIVEDKILTIPKVRYFSQYFVKHFVYSPVAQCLAVSAADLGGIHLYTGTKLDQPTHLRGPCVSNLAYSLDGKKVAGIVLAESGPYDQFCIWDTLTGHFETIYSRFQYFKELTEGLFEIDFHPNNKFLAVKILVSYPKSVIGIWCLNSNELLAILEFESKIISFRWMNEKNLQVHTPDGVKTWEAGKSLRDSKIITSSHSSFSLSSRDLDITNCYGLDDSNLALLKQTSSESPSHNFRILGESCKVRSENDVLRERNCQIYLSDKNIRLSGLSGEGEFVISPSLWLVSLVRKRNVSQNSNMVHVSLVIQGNKDNYSYIKEVHFFLDESKKKYLFETIGKGLVQIRDKTPRDLESQVRSNSYVSKSWNVSKEVALQLLTNVEQDRNTELSYLITGRSPGFFGRPAYNCLTFCIHHLKQVGIEFAEPSSNLLCAFPLESLPEPGQVQPTCLLM